MIINGWRGDNNCKFHSACFIAGLLMFHIEFAWYLISVSLVFYIMFYWMRFYRLFNRWEYSKNRLYRKQIRRIFLRYMLPSGVGVQFDCSNWESLLMIFASLLPLFFSLPTNWVDIKSFLLCSYHSHILQIEAKKNRKKSLLTVIWSMKIRLQIDSINNDVDILTT